MRKIISIIVSAAMLFTFGTIAYAADEGAFEYNIGENITVRFDEDTTLTAEERAQIVRMIADEHNPYAAAPQNLLCTVFGHNYKYSYVTVTTHKVYAKNPRCVEEEREIGVCSRCSDGITKTLSTMKIECCPED